MQLFVCDYEQIGERVTVNDSGICRQMRQVLRMKSWDRCQLQKIEADHVHRVTIVLDSLTKQVLHGTVVQEENREVLNNNSIIYLALPNKLSKLELICQKITELWIHRLCLWKAERSQLKTISPAKRTRLQKIILEAVEQAHLRHVPEIVLIDPTIEKRPDRLYVADFGWKSSLSMTLDSSKQLGLLVGPEWGLTPKDYACWWVVQENVVSFGESVLRMETAAIVGAWRIKNNHKE